MKKIFCINCYEESKHDEKFVAEIVNVRGLDLEVEHRYLECTICGELMEDPSNLDYNYIIDFKEYRRVKGLLQPEEIKMIREMYNMSQRDFADVLGMSHATLCRYEGGALQTEHHNSTFILATTPNALHKLVYMKFQATGNEKYENMLENIARVAGDIHNLSSNKSDHLELERMRGELLGYTNKFSKTQSIGTHVTKLLSGKHIKIHEDRRKVMSNFKGESGWKV
ncbi:hypothetical protein BMT55_09765 [Listeria newyorkensis]|uniref:HTH cro/C1-type domain-containing protein n=1 Tax=Listeria newyorkensis TaxID=1497681 RepID=A0ABX4XLQ6_9LIST|nr:MULTISPECIES: type II TA system antitoxin MqsA family protein [Listeria]KGL38145.1 hypothetical protein EP56_16760 [Listeriaceae bacterium FSL A5-0209]KGL39303.1 hypothetical protein EP58_14165 [Listeria newyorkensis]PNP91982.1 hypothetical protein BMT55_09765 [Listeria newyorkensis]RQW66111.1 transcriptional regulator [Listeria sp. SHR_NRA_18]WAO22250.1 transcriptional regulator [Listeria newyorkensis]